MVYDVLLECRNISSEKLACILNKFGKSFPFSFSIEESIATITDSQDTEAHQEKLVTATFSVESLSAVNELKRRLGHVKAIQFRFLKISGGANGRKDSGDIYREVAEKVDTQ